VIRQSGDSFEPDIFSEKGGLMIGETIGSYTIIRRLGEGGMGEVYLAEHRHIARRAAIKLLLPELTAKAEVASRFFTEARATSLIRHEGIVEILDCAVHTDGRAFIVMEFLEGESLAACLARIGSFVNDARSALAIVGQIASALAAAHAKGIVHRDLKPDNVFLESTPRSESPARVKILDFGIAKLVHEGQQSSLQKTKAGSLMGTPAYMSPEQCKGAGLVDHRSDIYSLGCIAFELASGRPPFVKEGAGEMLVAHVAEAPPRLSDLVPSAMPALNTLVMSMLEKDPARRPQSMTDVVRQIEQMLNTRSRQFATLMLPPDGFPEAPTTSPRIVALSPETTVTPPPGTRRSPVAAEAVAFGETRLLPIIKDEAGASIQDNMPEGNTTLSRTASESIDVTRRISSKNQRWARLAIGAAFAGAAVLLLMTLTREPSKRPKPAVVSPRPPEEPRPIVRQPVEKRVEITSIPAGAEIWVADEAQSRGVTPFSLSVTEGQPSVALLLKAPGFENKALTVEPARDSAVTVELRAIVPEDSSAVQGTRPSTKTPSVKKVAPKQKSKRSGLSPEGPYAPMGD